MTERVDLDALEQLDPFGKNQVFLLHRADFKGLIAELRASRKVVEAAREAFDDGRNLTWQRWEVFYPIHVALAALEEPVKP